MPSLSIPTQIKWLLVLVGLTLTPPAHAQVRENQIAGRDVSMSLLKRGVTPINLPPGSGLVTEKVRLTRIQSIPSLLRARSIVSDAESLSLVYELNPSLEQSVSIKAGSMLILPKLTGGITLQKALRSGDLVALTVDRNLKNQLRSSIDRIKELAPRVSTLEAARFQNPAARDETIRSIESIADSLDTIRRSVILTSQIPLSKGMLDQLVADTERMKSLLEGTLVSGHQLTSAEQREIILIQQDLRLKLEVFNESRGDSLANQDVRVIVKTIKADNSSPVPNLRIYFIREAWYQTAREATPFAKVTPAAEQMIQAGQYRLWALRDGDPSPVSEVLKVIVRKGADGGPYLVDLLIIR